MLHQMPRKRLQLNKKQKIAASLFAALLLIGAGVVAYSLRSQPPTLITPVKKAPKQAIKASVEPPKPEAYDRLSGLPTSLDLARRRPIAVMIENYYPEARPQSGLDKASVVFDTVAEGGITRFMAVFTAADTDIIGPIRSAREYYVNLARGFDAIYIHCGGSPGGYEAISNLGIDNIDQIGWSRGFWRSTERDAPHNLYSSTPNLREQSKIKGYKTELATPGFTFKDDAQAQARPAAQAVTVDFSSEAYRVRYVYQKDSNSYLRYMGGEPHVDAVTGKQLLVKNVAIMKTRIWSLNDDANRMSVETVGSGEAIVILDGRSIQATWKRPSSSDMLRFYDSSGKEIEFNRGQTWIEATDKPVKFE